jgi:hypothetical protein
VEVVDRNRSFVARFEIPSWETARRLVAVIAAFTGRYMMGGRDGVCGEGREKKSASSIVSNLRVLPLCIHVQHSGE